MKTFDDSDFKKKMNELQKQVMPQRMVKALHAAGMALWRDAINVFPTVPLREGWLRGSGSVHVNGKMVFESNEGKPGLANKGDTGMVDDDVVVVGFNAPYSAVMHEGQRQSGTHKVQNWSEPSSGPKFLESKLAMFGKQYQKLMAKVIREGQ